MEQSRAANLDPDRGEASETARLPSRATDVNASDGLGRTSLHRIVAKRPPNLNAVRSLLAKGADVSAKDQWRNTPLHMAEDNCEILRLLLERGADVNARNHNDETPLHLAAGKDRKKSEWLLANGANVDPKNVWGRTPLHAAALSGTTETLGLLLANAANINAEANDGETPLHVAAVSGRKEAVELLLAKGANVNANASAGETPLARVARSRGWNCDVARLLRKHGGKVSFRESLQWRVEPVTRVTRRLSMRVVKILKSLRVTRPKGENARQVSPRAPVSSAAPLPSQIENNDSIVVLAEETVEIAVTTRIRRRLLIGFKKTADPR